MATSKKKQENTEMDTNIIDPLVDLGVATSGTASTPEASTQENDMPRKTALEADGDFDFGDIKIGTVTELPTAARAKGKSKFPFDRLPAPKDGKISMFTVPFSGSTDEGKFKRSVQSAVTQANRTGEKDSKYFESRTSMKDGKLAGITVYRTDNRPSN